MALHNASTKHLEGMDLSKSRRHPDGPPETAILASSVDNVVDRNHDANRLSFDSGLLLAYIPRGDESTSALENRVDAATKEWLFGVDNGQLNLLLRGDFDDDGAFGAEDVHL